MLRTILISFLLIAVASIGACVADVRDSAPSRDSSSQWGLPSEEPSSVMVVAYIVYDGKQVMDSYGNPMGVVSSGTVVGDHHVLTVAHGVDPARTELEDVLGSGFDADLVQIRPVIYASEVAQTDTEMEVSDIVYRDAVRSTERADQDSDVAMLIMKKSFAADHIARLDPTPVTHPPSDGAPWPCGYQMVGYGAPLTEQVSRTAGAACLAPFDFVDSPKQREIADAYILAQYQVDVSGTEVGRPAKDVFPTVRPYSPYIKSWTLPFYGPLYPASVCKGGSGAGLYRVGTPSKPRALVAMHHGVWWPLRGKRNGQTVDVSDGCNKADSAYTISWYSAISNYADFISSTLATY
ncbi:MAG: hypothetical protein H6714_08510 [Myxococcales bacterium]|nr:hypothetical protein [Myxococcales bacterium]